MRMLKHPVKRLILQLLLHGVRAAQKADPEQKAQIINHLKKLRTRKEEEEEKVQSMASEVRHIILLPGPARIFCFCFLTSPASSYEYRWQTHRWICTRQQLQWYAFHQLLKKRQIITNITIDIRSISDEFHQDRSRNSILCVILGQVLAHGPTAMSSLTMTPKRWVETQPTVDYQQTAPARPPPLRPRPCAWAKKIPPNSLQSLHVSMALTQQAVDDRMWAGQDLVKSIRVSLAVQKTSPFTQVFFLIAIEVHHKCSDARSSPRESRANGAFCPGWRGRSTRTLDLGRP